MTTQRHPRQDIYYWKCDRPAAFHGLRERPSPAVLAEWARQLQVVLAPRFPGETIALQTGQTQGNHPTLTGRIGARPVFLRLEDGPERDDYLEVESHVLAQVARAGVPVPEVIQVDATRREVPFAWQVLARLPYPDLNQHYKAGQLELPTLAAAIGANVARWQAVQPAGFGPFDPERLRQTGGLQGFHACYEDYFFMRLKRHLEFLVEAAFLSPARADELSAELQEHRGVLARTPGVLVHKDLALWNILGTPDRIAAFIDWDDTIGGDPLDDISLLACFFDGDVIDRVLAGYQQVRPLPPDYRPRFWLHLLRNMITKAVIRVGAGYFERTDRFFLIGAGGSGRSLQEATQQRLEAALRGLRENADPTTL